MSENTSNPVYKLTTDNGVKYVLNRSIFEH